MNENLYNIAKSIIDSDSILAVVRVISSSGSTPGKEGHTMLVRENGQSVGSVGGGALELRAIADSKKLIKELRESKPDQSIACGEIIKEHLNLSLDKDSDLKMACTGEVNLEYRVFLKDCDELRTFLHIGEDLNRLVIFGAGHVAQALVPIAKTLDFSVVVCDDRPSLLTKQVHPEADEFCLLNYLDYSKSFEIKPNDWILIMTQGHAGDIDILKDLRKIWRSLKYIGVIGSDKKIALAKEELLKAGAEEEMASFLHAPVGFKVGGKTAAEIAVSIACELVAVKHGYFS